MFAIRTMGVVIALSATAAFAGEQTLPRADEVSFNSDLSRAEVIEEYQAARNAGLTAQGNNVALRSDELRTNSTLTRATVVADFQAARTAGLLPHGEQ